MKIKTMLACSMRGGRRLLSDYKKIIQLLESQGFVLVTKHQIEDDIFEKEKSMTPKQIYERDVRFIKEVDFLIAEVTNPSLGVGAEIAKAVHLDKKVLCIYKKEPEKISEYIIGMENVFSYPYENLNEIKNIVKNFVNKEITRQN